MINKIDDLKNMNHLFIISIFQNFHKQFSIFNFDLLYLLVNQQKPLQLNAIIIQDLFFQHLFLTILRPNVSVH